MQIAIDEINAAGGVNGKKIRALAFDTAGKPDQAVVGLRKLAEDDKVMALIGPFSSSRVPGGVPGGRACRHRVDGDGVLGAQARRAVHLCDSAIPPTKATCSRR